MFSMCESPLGWITTPAVCTFLKSVMYLAACVVLGRILTVQKAILLSISGIVLFNPKYLRKPNAKS